MESYYYTTEEIEAIDGCLYDARPLYNDYSDITGCLDDDVDLDRETELTEERREELEAEAEDLHWEIDHICDEYGIDRDWVWERLWQAHFNRRR